MPNNHYASTYNVHGDYQGRPYRNMVSQMPTDAVMSGYYAHHDGRGHSIHMQRDSGYFSRENYWDRNHARAPHDHYLPSGSSFAPARTGGGRPHIPLPPNACRTLYVEGLPADSTEREVAHIFRPFMGYMGLRLVRREPRQATRLIQMTVSQATYGWNFLAVQMEEDQGLTRFWELVHFPVQALDHVLKENMDHVSMHVSIRKRLPLKSESVEQERNREASNFVEPFNYALSVCEIRNQNIHKSGSACLIVLCSVLSIYPLPRLLDTLYVVAHMALPTWQFVIYEQFFSGSLNLTAGSALHDEHGMRFSFA
ncbi:UNVERIFIED_CONTAM: Protein MATERNALLY EXPRESSED [Sesamum indicum]